MTDRVPAPVLLPVTAPPSQDLVTSLMARIAQTYKEGGDWCSLGKAHALAALVLALRPRQVCEVGVWMGGSLVPMLMALQTLEAIEVTSHGTATKRRATAIDAWAPEDSVQGQGERDRAWWSSADHDQALHTFLRRLDDHGLRHLCDVVRASSERAHVDAPIDLLHVDGNHGEQAVRDVKKLAPQVSPGGVLVLDDLNWSGGHVARAQEVARDLGFEPRYPLDTGVVMLRVRA